MISSGLYNYLDVYEKAANAAWLRQEAISHNIANQDTPGYKRKEVNFESILQQELNRSGNVPLSRKVRNIDLERLNVSAHTDRATSPFSYRLDGNNVDPELEFVSLASNQIRYNALNDMIRGSFANLKLITR